MIIRDFIKSFSKYEKIIAVILITLILGAGAHGIFKLITKDHTTEIAKGGQYTEGLIGEVMALNPLFADFNEVDRDISRLIFSGLTKYDPETRNFVPDLATYQVSEDKKVYLFTLKDNLFWHDGTSLTADDVYFTYHDIIQDPGFKNPLLKAPFQNVEITKVNEKIIKFSLTKENSFFISNTLTGIVPKHILEKTPVEAIDQVGFNLQPIGSGPYQMDNAPKTGVDGKMQITLSVFKKYYGETPRIKNIKFFIFPSAEDLLKEKNSLNGIPKVSKTLYEDLKEDERFTFLQYKLPQYSAIIINTDSKFTGQKAIRAALSKSINKKELVSLLQYKAIVDTPFLELDQSSWIHQTNLEEANKILSENGWKIASDEDPYRYNSGKELLKLTLLVQQYEKGSDKEEEVKKTVDYLVSQWAKIGIKIEVIFADEAVFGDRMKNRAYDLILTGHNLGYNLDTYSFWHSSQANENGLNLSNYRSFQVDSLLENIRQTFYSRDKQEQLKKLEEAISNDVPAIFLYTPIYYFATDNIVKNFQINNFGFTADRFSNVARWYIKEK